MQKIQTLSLKNKQGTKITLTNFGATLISLTVKSAAGKLVNVVAGLSRAVDYTTPLYKKENKCLGATIGRFAGRISSGGFHINTTFYPLEHIDGVQLHGGSTGFQYRVWDIERITQGDNPTVVFKLVDTQGIHGFPGTVIVRAKYELTDSNALEITYSATTNKTTVLNLTNHSYFNLNGTGSILDHHLVLAASQVLETDERLVPTGKLLPTANSKYNFNWNKTLAEQKFQGLDTPFVCDGNKTQATLYSPTTGIQMQLQTNQPAVVIYTPESFNNLTLSNSGYSRFPAICFEAQGFPDAPNRPEFPSTLLHADDTYHNVSRYHFTIV